MKKLTCILFLLIGSFCQAQEWEFEKPNYEEIKKNIKKENSNFFYESLMNRFQNGDSTMTLEEKRHLYYGYVFDENYAPYSRSDYGDSLRVVLKKEKLDSLDLIKVVDFTNKILMENPFKMDALNYQLYALDKRGDMAEFNKKATQLRVIISALLSSGNGRNKEEAFYVINTSHEYEILNILGFEYGGKQSLIEHYDYLTLAENDAGLEGLYFDVSPCLNSMSNMVKD